MVTAAGFNVDGTASMSFANSRRRPCDGLITVDRANILRSAEMTPQPRGARRGCSDVTHRKITIFALVDNRS